MASQLHSDVFSWPPYGVFHADCKADAKDMGIDLIEDDVKNEILNMVKQSKEENRDEPFCVFDVGYLIEQFQLWTQAFPTIQPFYAVKAYDDPVVIKLLHQLGAGFDCASKGEIELVQKVGVESDSIVFANPIKLPSHLVHAAENGVSLMTFDCKDELVKIKKHYPEARLLLRICPTSEQKLDLPFLDVFGCHMDEVEDLVRTAKLLDLSLVGVCFHLRSGFTNPDAFTVELNNAREVFDIAGREGIQMNILDIGGGFYGTKGEQGNLLRISSKINNCIKENFPGITVFSEPGRFFVESGLTMAASIIGKRDRRRPACSDEIQEIDGFVLSASAFGIVNRTIALACSENKTYYPTLALRKPSSSDTFNYCLRGPTVAPIDVIHCGNLPQLQVGDWLTFEDVGAYSVSITSTFNGFQKPTIRRVMKKNLWKTLVYPVIKGKKPESCSEALLVAPGNVGWRRKLEVEVVTVTREALRYLKAE